jgi:hypothetical protein
MSILARTNEINHLRQCCKNEKAIAVSSNRLILLQYRSADRAGFSACCRNKAAFAERRRGFFLVARSPRLSLRQALYFVSILQTNLCSFAHLSDFLRSDINLLPMICLHGAVGTLTLACNR